MQSPNLGPKPDSRRQHTNHCKEMANKERHKAGESEYDPKRRGGGAANPTQATESHKEYYSYAPAAGVAAAWSPLPLAPGTGMYSSGNTARLPSPPSTITRPFSGRLCLGR